MRGKVKSSPDSFVGQIDTRNCVIYLFDEFTHLNGLHSSWANKYSFGGFEWEEN